MRVGPSQTRFRSGSSLNSPAIRLRKTRVDKSEDLHRLRKSIQQAFESQDKGYYQVKELTAKVGPAHSSRINQICVKYSICSNPRKRKTEPEDIDVEAIARSYINSKSKQKRQELLNKQLKRAIAQTSRRYQDSSSPDWLKERKASGEAIDKSRTQQGRASDRCYLTIYQRSQAEVIERVVKQHKMEMQEIGECPKAVVMEEWERQQKQLKEVYRTVKNLRAKATKYRQRTSDKEEATGTFYIT